MNVNLFKLALERLESTEWAHFERLCSTFLAAEFETLRTMASPSGDSGRDSELFSPTGNAVIAAQYSVASDWKNKIRRTVSRIHSELPDVRILVYLSNQIIGAKADDLRKEILARGFSLDIRDRNWFLERASTNPSRESAAEELIDRIARPYLQSEQIIARTGTPLTSNESKAALLYLGLQLEDDETQKGLTKVSFDALVRSALRHTNSEHRLPRDRIHEAIVAVLRKADAVNVIQLTDAALIRLTKRFIRHWQQEDSFCLTYDESQRMEIQLATFQSQLSEFMASISTRITKCLPDDQTPDMADSQDLSERVQRVIQGLFLRQGEAFVEALQSGLLSRIGLHDLNEIVIADIQRFPSSSKLLSRFPEIISTVVTNALHEPDLTTHQYLRRLSNSYTLFAFLNHTPDVQSATRKLFSYGTIWVDTTILLPLFSEYLDDSGSRGNLRSLFKVCHDAGIQLRTTHGIIQEVEAHMSNALLCSQFVVANWKGRTPYLYHQFLAYGTTSLSFAQWLEQFRGNERPHDDLIQFLQESFGFELKDLDTEAQKLPEELRFAVDRLWSDAHKKRRQTEEPEKPTTDILTKHDIETYLGVISLRQNEPSSDLGYRNWLLTHDSVAWEIRDYLRKERGSASPTSPLLSLSFLINSMAFGAYRPRMSNTDLLTLPLILDVELAESMPHDMLAIADKIRKENAGLPERVIRRKVRDAIDTARRRRSLPVLPSPSQALEA